MAENYTPHDWKSGDLITAQQMNSLEQGVGNLSTSLSALDSEVTAARGDKSNLNARLQDLENADTSSAQDINTLKNTVMVIGANYATNTDYANLTDRVNAKITEINAAHRTTEDTLKERFEDIEASISSIDSSSSISAITSKVTSLEETVGDKESGLVHSVDTLSSTVGNASSGLVKDVVDLQTTVGNNNSGLVKSVADNTAAISSMNTALVGKASTDSVTNLQNLITNNSTTVIADSFPVSNISTANDYLIKNSEDNKYYYWKYINNNWELISGGASSESGDESGGGTSSAEFYAALENITEPDVNIDYFIGNGTDGYTHYRYIASTNESETGAFVTILPNNLINSLGVDTINVTTADALGENEATVTQMSGGLKAYAYGDNEEQSNLLANFTALRYARLKRTYEEDGQTLKKQELIFTDTTGTDLPPIEIVGGVGGGSSYSIRLVNTTGAQTIAIPSTQTTAMNLSARPVVNFGVNLAEGVEINAEVQYKLSTSSVWQNANIYIPPITNNQSFTINVISLLGDVGTTTDILLRIFTQPDSEGDIYSASITYHINKVNMYIESINFDQSAIRTGNSFIFQYKCYGSDLSKVVTFKIDGVETTKDVGTSHNKLESQQIDLSNLERGAHSFQVYFTSDATQSNILNYYIIYNDSSDEYSPLVAVASEKVAITDGDELKFNYTVYSPNSEVTEEVEIKTYTLVDGTETIYDERSLQDVRNNVVQNYIVTNYPPSGTLYVMVTARHYVDSIEYVDEQITSVIINEYESEYTLEYAGESNLLYAYSAYGKTNNDIDKDLYSYSYTDVEGHTTSFNGISTKFNWATNGYINNALVISGDAKHNVTLPIFTSSYSKNGTTITLESDKNYESILKNGRTVEIDYEVVSAADLSATIMKCADANNTGFTITPQACYLVKQNAQVQVDNSGLIHNEESIAAAYLSTNTHMHLAFVIEPASDTITSNGEYHQCVNIYVNGEFANSCPYDKSDTFSTNATLSIGDPSCIIKLYSIRMYNRGLTHDEILNNYMMSPNTKQQQETYFRKNDILNSNGTISYDKAKLRYNCLLLTGEMAPYKGDKIPCGLTLTKPSASGYSTEFELLDKDDEGKYYSSNNVQGTSSQKYPVHNLKVYLARKKIETVIDEQTQEETEVVSSAKVKYSLKPDNRSIGESTLCWKADYMSTDHANTYNANWADTLFTDKLPSQLEEPKVQNTVYGIRCLLFVRKDESSTPVFIGDGCLNNDKGNNKTFGLEMPGDSGNNTTRQKWEFTNNSSELCYFQSDALFQPVAEGEGVYHIKALDAFESTYPDQGDLEKAGLTPNYNHFQMMLTWVTQRANYWDASDEVDGKTYSYNGESYDNEKAYRKAIFLNEFTRHFNLNHTLTYHLFSEFIALCDNRAKNMFLRCDDVTIENIKTINGDTLFEGNSNPDSTLWNNFVDGSTGIVNADYIDWGNSTFAVWVPVLYDLDSCYGVENVGYINIAYDADWNYEYNSTKQFSGSTSRFWLMVEDSFATELTALARTLYPQTNGLNYNTVYNQQIVANNEATCPALVNQDMLLKFNAYWADGFMDYSLATPTWVYKNYKYLQRGSRATQKNLFIRRRANYLSSKYATNNFMNDTISFRSGIARTIAESGISLTVNQTLYPAITYGDNKPAIRSLVKLNTNESTTLYAGEGIEYSDTIHIGGASALTTIQGLPKFLPYQVDVAGGINLKSLILGSSEVTNNQMDKIDNLAQCTLLEEINVENCPNLGGESAILNLSNNGLIRIVNTKGSKVIPELPNGGVLEELYLGSASTIKILNQSRLTTFSYDDSDYAAVTRLWIENTPNVPIVDIIEKTFNHLTNGLRLVGIDITLDDAHFLELLASDYAKGKYLTGDGSYVAGNDERPYVSGSVTINSIRQTLVDKLNEYYPYLKINADNVIQDHQIIYRDWDGTELLRLSASSGETIPDPIIATDVYGNVYLSEPTRAQDAEATYSFGRHSGGNYIEYSGWKRLQQNGTYITNDWIMPDSNVVLVAEYSKITRQYKIEWYTDDGGKIKEISGVNYGTDLANSGIGHPRIGDTNLEKINFYKYSTVNKYKILTGWDTPLTGTLTGDMRITGIYEENNYSFNSETSFSLADLNAADLYALSETNDMEKGKILDNLLNNTYYTVTMGNDIDYNNIESTDLIKEVDVLKDNITLTGASNGYKTLSNFTPLRDNGAFTIAFDLKPLMNSSIYGSTEYVLASCYKETQSAKSGFRLSLYNDNHLKVFWGDSSVNVDNYSIQMNGNSFGEIFSYRTMVVIAHDAGSSDLRVYFGNPNSEVNIIQDSITTTRLTYNSSLENNNPIILGGALNSSGNIANTNIMRPGACAFYWIKYWDTALSADDCLTLAAWPHKKVRFALAGYKNERESTDNQTTLIIGDNNAKLNFVAMEPISDRFYSTNNLFDSSTTTYSWITSNLKTFCQNRIFAAMPLKYQALLKNTTFSVLRRTVSNNTADHSGIEDTAGSYIYLPSYAEIVNETQYNDFRTTYGQEATHPWPWMDGSNIPVYTTDASNRLIVSTTANLDVRPLRFRFLDNIITSNNKVFDLTTNPYTSNGYVPSWGGDNIYVQPGDVWYNSTASAVYIFVTAEQIENGAAVEEEYVCTDAGGNIAGGWLQSIPWITRSYNVNLSVQNSNSPRAFIGVNELGSIIASQSSSNQIMAYAICPAFSI